MNTERPLRSPTQDRPTPSRRLTRPLLMFALVLAFAAAAFGQTPNTTDSLRTVAGELKIIELEAHCKYQIVLNDKTILETDCHNEASEYYDTPQPTIHTFHKALSGAVGFEEVVLFQMQMLGNACDGGDLIFLGLKHDKSHVLSKGIDFCGGRPPVVTWSPDKVTVFIPGGPPNRGPGYIASETWVYEKGKVTKLRAKGKRN